MILFSPEQRGLLRHKFKDSSLSRDKLFAERRDRTLRWVMQMLDLNVSGVSIGMEKALLAGWAISANSAETIILGLG